MRKTDVRNEHHALAYLLDCALATVESLAARKSRPVGDFRRQIGIAQAHYDWCRAFGVDVSTTRAADLPKFDHQVEAYAAHYMP